MPVRDEGRDRGEVTEASCPKVGAECFDFCPAPPEAEPADSEGEDCGTRCMAVGCGSVTGLVSKPCPPRASDFPAPPPSSDFTRDPG